MDNLYFIPVWETIGAAWGKVKGAKTSIWVAIIIILLFTILFKVLEKLAQPNLILKNIIYAIDFVVLFLLQMGYIRMGIKRAFDLPISYRMMFETFEFPTMIKTIGLYLLELVIALLPIIIYILLDTLLRFISLPTGLSYFLSLTFFILAIMAFTYLVIRMLVAFAFVLDKGVNPFVAIKKSFEATRGNFWRLVLILIIQLCTFIVSLIPLGIGLIWTLPFLVICYGVIYKNLLNNVSESSVIPANLSRLDAP